MNLHDTATALTSYALQSGLLLAVGLILPRMLRFRHPRTLLAYWRVLLIVVLVLPLAPLDLAGSQSLPYLTLEGLQVEAVVTGALPSTLPGLSWQIAFSLIAGVALLGILRLALGIRYLNACRRQASPLDPPPAPVSDLQGRLGVSVPFLVSNWLTTPLTYGWLRPSVLLPQSFQKLSADEQEGVACHELLHVRRRDWPMAFLEALLQAVVWFHPAVWLILPRIALAREQVVDMDTVRLTGKRRQYLDALWSVICSRQPTVTLAAMPLLGRRDLIDRVAWIQKEIKMSKTRIAFSVLVLIATVPAVAVFGASVFGTNQPSALSVSGESSEEESKEKSKHEEYPKLKTISGKDLCDEITHPVVINKVNPKYPPSARDEKVMGVVTVETVITEEGVVEDIRVLRSPDERLSAAAVEAIQQWTFEPALCDGTPVGVYYNLTIKFNLQ
jgi:D-alanyl-D-alanine endopeptidase (penicillin-binding protein 7)